MVGLLDIIAGPVMKILDKIIPDPAAKAAAQLQILQLQQAGEFKQIEADLQMAQGQMDINKQEAASGSLFVSGWRPFVGWVCGGALAYQFLFRPIVGAILTAYSVAVNFPTLDMGTLMTLLFAMLGVGSMRTAEKINGVARS